MTPPLRTVPAALQSALAHDAARPLVTHLGAGGMRTELSVRTFENNVAKAANLLRDDIDLQPGDVVALALPAHWQTSVWLAAVALVGGVARLGDDTDGAELAVVGPSGLDLPQAPTTLATALHPLGMPFTTPLPAGVLDAATEVRAHGDRFSPSYAVRADDAWLEIGGVVRTHGEALDAAARLASTLGLERGGRLLVTRPLDDDVALALLAVPLALDAAVVVLDDPELPERSAYDSERCTAVLR